MKNTNKEKREAPQLGIAQFLGKHKQSVDPALKPTAVTDNPVKLQPFAQGVGTSALSHNDAPFDKFGFQLGASK